MAQSWGIVTFFQEVLSFENCHCLIRESERWADSIDTAAADNSADVISLFMRMLMGYNLLYCLNQY